MGRLIGIYAALILCTVLTGACDSRPDGERLRVYAAASLTDAMEALADTFQVLPGGGDATVNVAGSSLLARQIDRGARADVFVSAHSDWTDFLHERERIDPPIVLPISNRLVEIRRPGAPIQDGERPRLALADPSHVPAGMYAREALECEGRWREVEADLVPTLDVRAALAAVQTGAVSSAIVYASDALLAPELEIRDAVSERCQPDVRYTAGLVRGSSRAELAGRFLELIRSPDVEALWRRYGFTVHKEDE